MVPVGGASELRTSCLEGPRVRLRKARNEDTGGLLETQIDKRARWYLGGPRPVEEVRVLIDSTGTANLLESTGCYVAVAGDSAEMLGMVTLDRRRNDVPSHLDPRGDELELSYVFRPHAGAKATRPKPHGC